MILILQTLTLLLVAVAFVHLRNRLKRLERNLKEDQKKLLKVLNREQRSRTNPQPFSPAAEKNSLIKVKNAEPVNIAHPAPDSSRGGPYFALGPHKSGTVLLNALLADLAKTVHMPCADIPAALFTQGIDMSEVAEMPSLFAEKGILLTGFRSARVGDKDLFIPHGGKAVVLVRDPRDILVSLYFSEAKSHTLPDQGKVRDAMLKLREEASSSDLDNWAIQRAPSVARTFARWSTWVAATGQDKVKDFRYEDVIFEKERWLSDMNEWFGWQAPADAVCKIAAKHDIRPTDEDAARHIRKVAPGDHREKLKPETIAQLNEILREPAAKFGYQL